MVLIEALILAAIGVAFGITAGLYLGYMVVGALSLLGFQAVYIFPVQGILLAILAGLAFGALAAILPARQAVRLEIVAALRYE